MHEEQAEISSAVGQKLLPAQPALADLLLPHGQRKQIELAHTLNCSVVAEGIETAHALEVLREMGCDIAQGYYISAPQPAEEIEQWLEENTLVADQEKAVVT